MSIDKTQLRELIIRPTLKHLGYWSASAEELLMGTAAQESHLGQYVHQLGGGPALGIFQMEPVTYEDIWDNYVRYQSVAFRNNLARLSPELPNGTWYPDSANIIGNLYLATAMARLHYRRVREPLPPAGDTMSLARYWKQYYNTPLGRGRPTEFVDNYIRYVA